MLVARPLEFLVRASDIWMHRNCGNSVVEIAQSCCCCLCGSPAAMEAVPDKGEVETPEVKWAIADATSAELMLEGQWRLEKANLKSRKQAWFV
jgi:hypothetical protein